MLDRTNPKTKLDEIIHGLPHPMVSRRVNYLAHNTSEDNWILEFYKAYSFDPNSDKLVCHFNLLMIEYLPCKSYLPHC